MLRRPGFATSPFRDLAVARRAKASRAWRPMLRQGTSALLRLVASCRTPGPTRSMSAPRPRALADGDRESGRGGRGRVELRPTRRRLRQSRSRPAKRGGLCRRAAARCSCCFPKGPIAAISSRRCKMPIRASNARCTRNANAARLSAQPEATPVRTAGKRGTACGSSRRKPETRGTAASAGTCGNSPGKRRTRFGPSRRAPACGKSRRTTRTSA